MKQDKRAVEITVQLRTKIRHLGSVAWHGYRNFQLRHIYHMKIAKTAVLYGGFEIRDPWNISLGDGSIIGDESKLDGRNGIIIGDNVNFSTGVWIWTEEHDLNDSYFRCNNKGGLVQICDRAWLSCRTIILPGVTIGEGAVIAAGAVVTKNVDDYSIMGETVRKLGHETPCAQPIG